MDSLDSGGYEFSVHFGGSEESWQFFFTSLRHQSDIYPKRDLFRLRQKL